MGQDDGKDVVFSKLEDLDGDGEDEVIQIRDYNNIYTILNINSEVGLISDLKIKGKIKSPDAILFHDTDLDGVMDIWSITRFQDTLWLNFSDLYSVKESHKIIAVDPEYSLENYDYWIEIAGVYDDHFFFAINSGYPLQPRAIYSFNWKTKEIKRTKDEGSLLLSPYFFDLNKDGTPEIITRSFAPTNIHYNVPYTDSSAWLRVFDVELNHIFDPVEYPCSSCKIDVFPVETDTANYLAVSSRYGGMTEIEPKISLTDKNGEIVKAVESDEYKNLFQFREKLYSYNFKSKYLYEVNSDLELSQEILQTEVYLNPKDIANQGSKGEDFLFVSTDGDKLGVIPGNLSGEITVILDESIVGHPIWSNNTLIVQTANKIHFLKLQPKNKKTIWLIFFGVVFIQVAILIWFWRIKPRISTSKKNIDKDYIIFKTGDQRLKVKYDDIEYLEAAGGPYTNVYLSTQEKPLLLVKNIGAIEKELPDRFLRISRKCIVKKGIINGLNPKTRKVQLETSRGIESLEISKNRISQLPF